MLETVETSKKLSSNFYHKIVERYHSLKEEIKIDYRETCGELLGLKIVVDRFTDNANNRIFGLLREEHIGALLSWEEAVEDLLKKFPEGKIIDGGLGSGVLGIWAAKKSLEIYQNKSSNKIIGFDINEKAIRYSKANSLINNVEHLMEFRYQSYEESSFEKDSAIVVLLNPPYQLVAPGFKAPIHADGGYDGLKIVRIATWSAAQHICRGGIICMTTKAIGTHERSLIEKEFAEGKLVGNPEDFSMDVINILSPIKTEEWVNYIYQDRCPEYANQLSKQGNYLHFIVTLIRKDGGGGLIRKLEPSLNLEGYGWQHHLEAHKLMTNVMEM